MRLPRLLLSWAVLSGATAACALPDPTQPPARLAGPAGAVAGPSGSGDWAPLAPPARPVLQSLRLGPRPSALIDGQLRQPGERLGAYVLLRIETDAVVLRDEQARIHRILLLPAPASTPRKEVRP
ncbi:hypothetical protein HNQ51_001924 [Inhella inkyongensis]|uniref:MSHA biogenesis protein MshK n=1 Tax=Inhella inkyongensis TaxID=392593 RepID=A0A840S849_9BURK|nr:hypothetical protein [Inhella inkyongensis]MBB5204610.1 hypothetical protein [Inhella inkyongensis]